MAPARGAQWERVLRDALPDVDPRWTLTGRGSRAALTWGTVGWVWQHVGLELGSGQLHELYASRSWTDQPFSITIDKLARDLTPEDSPDRLLELDDADAVGRVRRFAALVPDEVFGRSLQQDLDWFEWSFQRFLDSGSRLPWTPLAGLRVQCGGDARPVVDAAEAQLLRLPSVRRRQDDHPGLLFWRELRARLDDSRDEALSWLDDHRRRELREQRVPDDLVEDVLDGASPSR